MAKRQVFLEYMFLFDPDQTWNSIGTFENDLSDFFAAHGFEANVIKTIDGQVGRRILSINKSDVLSQETNHHNESNNPPGRPLSFKTVLNRKRAIRNVKAAERNFKQGKFLPSKGYIKR